MKDPRLLESYETEEDIQQLLIAYKCAIQDDPGGLEDQAGASPGGKS